MKKGNNNKTQVEYQKPVPKFIQILKAKVNTGYAVEDKMIKIKEAHDNKEIIDDGYYDLENANIEGEDQELVDQVKKQLKDKEFDLNKFKPVFQKKQEKAESKQDAIVQKQSNGDREKKTKLVMKKKLTILSFNEDNI